METKTSRSAYHLTCQTNCETKFKPNSQKQGCIKLPIKGPDDGSLLFAGLAR